MPRQSIEAKAAASTPTAGATIYRAEPPAELPEAAAEVWRDILASRPADWFAPGNLELLAVYCRMVVLSRVLLDIVEADPMDSKALARLTKTTAAMTTIGVKLRLTVQSNLDRKSRKLDEVQPQAKPTGLLGGRAVAGLN